MWFQDGFLTKMQARRTVLDETSSGREGRPVFGTVTQAIASVLRASLWPAVTTSGDLDSNDFRDV